MKHRILILLPVTAIALAEPTLNDPRSYNSTKVPQSKAPSQPTKTDPHAKAKAAVLEQVAFKLETRHGRFSRAAPRSPSPSYSPELLVDGEKRLPFKVADRFSRKSVLAQGYVRLSDQQIFILDPLTGKHRAVHEDPRFAPKTPTTTKPKT